MIRPKVHLSLFLGKQRLMAPATDVATKVVPAMTPAASRVISTMSDEDELRSKAARKENTIAKPEHLEVLSK